MNEWMFELRNKWGSEEGNYKVQFLHQESSTISFNGHSTLGLAIGLWHHIVWWVHCGAFLEFTFFSTIPYRIELTMPLTPRKAITSFFITCLTLIPSPVRPTRLPCIYVLTIHVLGVHFYVYLRWHAMARSPRGRQFWWVGALATWILSVLNIVPVNSLGKYIMLI